MRPVYLFGLCLLAITQPAGAQAIQPPPIVLEGLRQLATVGVDTAVTTWFRGSQLEGDTAKAGVLVREFAKIPDWMGKPVSFDVVRVFTVGPHFSRTYALVLLEGGVLYFRFDYYLGPHGWTIQHLDFHSDGAKVFPASLLSP